MIAETKLDMSIIENEIITDLDRVINLEKEINDFLKTEKIKGKVKMTYYRNSVINKNTKVRLNFSFELNDIKKIAMFFFIRDISFKLMSFPTHLKDINCMAVITERDVKQKF